MKSSTYVILFSVYSLSLNSCSEPEEVAPQGTASHSEVEEIVADAKKFVNSFEGKSVSEAKQLLGGATFTEADWLDHGVPNVKGIEIVATYTDYEVILFAVNDKVIMTSIHILAD